MITGMSLVYVTGAPGSGKSTILRRLKTRDYTAYGTDEHDMSHWVNRRNGDVTVPQEGYDLHEWYKNYEWTLNPQKVTELRDEADTSGKTVYLLGVAAGLEAVQHNFDCIVVLVADEATLKKRINERRGNSFGKTPHELRIILDWQNKHVESYQKQGAIVIETSHLSPEEAADKVVEAAEDKRTGHVKKQRY